MSELPKKLIVVGMRFQKGAKDMNPLMFALLLDK